MNLEILVARKQKKLTQQEIADKVGISRTFYSLVESGKRTPSVTTLSRIQDVLGVEKLDLRNFNK